MWRFVPAGILGLLTLGLTGCGGSAKPAAHPAEPVLGSPVPTPRSTADPKVIGKSPSAEEPFLARIKYALATDTVKMAGSAAKTRVACDRATLRVADGETVHCTVSYAALFVPWTVTVKGGPSMLVPYDAVPATGVLSRAGILRSFYASKTPYGTDLRCGDLPEAVLVPLGKRTPYRCQYVSKPDKTYKLPSQRITMAVISKQTGPDFELPFDVH